MAVKAAPVAPPVPVYTWTGWYVGLNGGWVDKTGGTNTDAVILSTSTFPINATNIANSAANRFGGNANGFIGGAQFGYNAQLSPRFVVGFEADIQGTSLRDDHTAINTLGGETIGGIVRPFWVTTTSVSNRLDWFGTVRGRIGMTATPSFLFCGTGGLAYGGVRSSTAINFNNTDAAVPGATSASLSSTRVGWTAGVGGEWMFSPNWTAKLEYLYYDLGSTTYATGGYAVDVSPTTFAGTGIASVATSTTTKWTGNIVRVGVNYKFGGPVVAKY
jgi:outer membrane immunogenic protein